MKTFFATIILSFVLISDSFAQQRPARQITAEEREYAQIVAATRQTELLADFLELNETQIDVVFEIYFRFGALRFQAMDDARTESRTDLRTTLETLDEQRDAEILSVLEPGQTERFLQQQSEAQMRREQMRQAVEDRRRTGDLQRDTADRSLIVPVFTEP
jgi:hypothetical protein